MNTVAEVVRWSLRCKFSVLYSKLLLLLYVWRGGKVEQYYTSSLGNVYSLIGNSLRWIGRIALYIFAQKYTASTYSR